MPPGKNGSKNLKILLIQRGIKQYELAMACGFAESKMSAIVTGRRRPTEEELAKMAFALKMKPEKLAKEAGWA